RRIAVVVEIQERRDEEAGDRALHVDRAASEQLEARALGRERRMRPGGFLACRYDIGVPGEGGMLLSLADARAEIGDVRSAQCPVPRTWAARPRSRRSAAAGPTPRARRRPPASRSGSGSDLGRLRPDRKRAMEDGRPTTDEGVEIQSCAIRSLSSDLSPAAA